MLTRKILPAVLILLGIYVVFLRAETSAWLFHPAVYPEGDWATARIYHAQEHHVPLADGQYLDAWLIPSFQPARTVLFFHGRRGNLTDLSTHYSKLRDLRSDVFAVDYSGYGKSPGRPSIGALYRDGEAAYQYVTGQLHVPPTRLVVQGDELGSVIAARIAAQHPDVAALVLESPFPSLRHLANSLAPLAGWLLPGQMNEVDSVAKYLGPKLVLYGTGDPMIAPALSHAVFVAASNPKTEHVIPDAGSSDLLLAAGDNYGVWQDALYAQAHLATPAAAPQGPAPTLYIGNALGR